MLEGFFYDRFTGQVKTIAGVEYAEFIPTWVGEPLKVTKIKPDYYDITYLQNLCRSTQQYEGILPEARQKLEQDRGNYLAAIARLGGAPEAGIKLASPNTTLGGQRPAASSMPTMPTVSKRSRYRSIVYGLFSRLTGSTPV